MYNHKPNNCVCFLFCYAVLSVISIFANIFAKNRELVDLL